MRCFFNKSRDFCSKSGDYGSKSGDRDIGRLSLVHRKSRDLPPNRETWKLRGSPIDSPLSSRVAQVQPSPIAAVTITGDAQFLRDVASRRSVVTLSKRRSEPITFTLNAAHNAHASLVNNTRRRTTIKTLH